jgi:hypothetical protein
MQEQYTDITEWMLEPDTYYQELATITSLEDQVAYELLNEDNK